MPRRQEKIAIGREQRQAVTNAKLCEQGIDGADLQAGAATAVSQLGGFDVILPVRREKRQVVEVIDDRLACPWPGESLQKLLQDQAGRENHAAALQGGAKRVHLGRGSDLVTPEGKRPDTGIDKQVHRRDRAAL